MKNIALFMVLAAVASFPGCGEDNVGTTSPSEPTSPTTSHFVGRITVNGSAARVFTISSAGTVTVRLVNAGGPFTVMGLGLGVPFGGVSNCTLSTSLNTASGSAPQIVAPVDPGTYCVALYDVGELRGETDFEVTITYP
jgi:hypothetical protein